MINPTKKLKKRNMNVQVPVNITNKNSTGEPLDEDKISVVVIPELKI